MFPHTVLVSSNALPSVKNLRLFSVHLDFLFISWINSPQPRLSLYQIQLVDPYYLWIRYFLKFICNSQIGTSWFLGTFVPKSRGVDSLGHSVRMFLAGVDEGQLCLLVAAVFHRSLEDGDRRGQCSASSSFWFWAHVRPLLGCSQANIS